MREIVLHPSYISVSINGLFESCSVYFWYSRSTALCYQESISPESSKTRIRLTLVTLDISIISFLYLSYFSRLALETIAS